MTSEPLLPEDHAFPIRLPAELARGDADRRYPVEDWHPARCGDSAMRIDRDGGWWHEGRPITRPALARLFARLLRREADGRHVLVTPAEMLDIAVDDAPLIANEVESEGTGETREVRLRIALLDEWIILGCDHRITIEPDAQGVRPYVSFRAGLRARIDRPAYYALAEIALAEGDPPGLWSGGLFHNLSGEAA